MFTFKYSVKEIFTLISFKEYIFICIQFWLIHKSSNIKNTGKSSLATKFPKRKKIKNRNFTLKVSNATTMTFHIKIKNDTTSRNNL